MGRASVARTPLAPSRDIGNHGSNPGQHAQRHDDDEDANDVVVGTVAGIGPQISERQDCTADEPVADRKQPQSRGATQKCDQFTSRSSDVIQPKALWPGVSTPHWNASVTPLGTEHGIGTDWAP